MIVAPAVVVGLAAIGFAAPANAVDGDPADSSTSSTPAATPVQPVKPAAVIGLANTGSDAMAPLALGGLLAALGALLALGTWWRRRTSRTE